MPNGYFVTATFRNFRNLTSARLTIVADLNGQLQINSYDINLIDDIANAQILNVPIGGLKILHCSVILTAGISDNGFCYCVLSLNKSHGVTTERLSILANGYCNNNQSVGWPFQGQSSVYPEVGCSFVFADNPAAGAPSEYTVPAGLVVRVLGVKGQLATNAVVLNRRLFFSLLDPAGNFVSHWRTDYDYTASTNQGMYGYDIGCTVDHAAGAGYIATPQPWLSAGYMFRFGVTPMDVGDDMTMCNWLLEARLCL